MDGKNNGSFWPSYVDIMTTLFAIMLVLFAVTFSRFKNKEIEIKEINKQLELLVHDYEDILNVYSTVSSIDSTRYFGYNEKYLKHLFTVDVEYQLGEYHINKLNLDKIDVTKANTKRDSIIEAGRIIQNTILKLKQSEKKNIKFLIVIEGQSSRVPYNVSEYENNYTLSYLRAQFLNKFWKANGIDLASIPRCELIISGSGEDGVPRVMPKIKNPRTPEERSQWTAEESKNQRFLINIVPVIGNIEVTKEKIEQLNSKK